MTLPPANSEFGSTAAGEDPLFGEPKATSDVYSTDDTTYVAPTQTYSGSTASYGDASGDSSEDSAAKAKAKETAAEAKDKAADVKDSAVEAGTHVASVAKDQAGTVAAEAGQHAKNLLSQTRGELSTQASSQQQRVAGGLHSLADELHSMASGNEQSGVASDLARQAADRTKSIASWIEDREPADLLRDVTDFARRRPGLFIAIAAGAGVLTGRMARGIKDEASTDAPSSSPSALTSGTGYTAPVTTGYTATGTGTGYVADSDYAAGTYATSADPLTTDGVIR